MRAVIQRVSHASVTVDKKVIAEIKGGLLILLGVEENDNSEDIDWLCAKIPKMRIFGNDQGLMNLSVQDVGGDIIVVSQFTLHASTKKGNRPSYIKSARPEQAIPLYETFIQKLSSEMGKPIFTGEFGAHMDIMLTNDGPVTIIIDTKCKE